MLSQLDEYFNQYNSVGIIGFGNEGKSLYDFLLRRYPELKIFIFDVNPINIEINNNIQCFTGVNYLEKLSCAELLVKSPGISYHKNVECFKKLNLTTSSEIFLKYFKKNTIGVTGTKGKSTTAKLIYSLLKEDKDVHLVGNIGMPVFDVIDILTPESLCVYEFSSYQLENCRYSPATSVLLNLFEEHLDYHLTKRSYFSSKLNIFANQDKEDIAIFNSKNLEDINSVLKSEMKIMYDKSYVPLIRGKNHLVDLGDNRYIHRDSIRVLKVISDLFKYDDNWFKEVLHSFKPLEHRVEFVGRYSGIDFYNDSISTVPEAAMSAVSSVGNVETLILGGYDRGIDYTSFVQFLLGSSLKNIVLLSQTGERIYNLLYNESDINKNIVHCSSLEQALMIVKKCTNNGSVCMFSPASPSYCTYKNFIERGNSFKELIKKVFGEKDA